MAADQLTLLLILLLSLLAFVSERWRPEVVACCSLAACLAAGLVRPEEAFAGLANPAVVTVAAVLALTGVLVRSGALEPLLRPLLAGVRSELGLLTRLCSLAILLSAFMNNIGALALLLPVALAACARLECSPSLVLMPLAFATLLGGMTTLIGTPANLIVDDFRLQATGERFAVFDFALVAAPLCLAGLACLALLVPYLVPLRRPAASTPERESNISGYVTELAVTPRSSWVGQPLAILLARRDFRLHGVVREGRRLFGRPQEDRLQAGDLVLLETDRGALRHLLQEEGLAFAEDRGEPEASAEAVVMPNALLLGSSPLSLDLRNRWGITLVAAARQGRRFEGRLRDATFALGDVLMLRGPEGRLLQAIEDLGCLPLAQAPSTPRWARRPMLPLLVFATAVLGAAAGLLAAALAFAGALLLLVLLRAVPPQEIFRSLDWPVIVLVAAMIPVGGALQSSGLAEAIAGAGLAALGPVSPLFLLGTVLLTAMLLTPLLNNPATVVAVAPLALEIAARAGLSPDPFLIAVAIGASCDFLTPIGHHNNAIVMGPGHYRFTDYARAGWPLYLLIFALSLLLIPLAWPLRG